jgi:predicted ester cyclase
MDTTASDQIRMLGRMLIENINKGDLLVVDRLFADNHVEHDLPPGFPTNYEGFKQYLIAFRKAFPDALYTIEDEIVEGDKLAHRLRCRATMKGDFLGLPAAGKTAEWEEMHIGRIENGKIVEHWGSVDQLGMLQQLGLAPAPGSSS